jgi:hypothetical protein
MLDDRLAHRAAFARVLDGALERGSGHPDALSRDPDPTSLEIGERDAVSLALGAEPQRRLELEILEAQAAGNATDFAARTLTAVPT